MNYRNIQSFCLTAVVASAVPVSLPGEGLFSINERWEVREYHNLGFHDGESAQMGWTGDYETGDPGTVSAEWQAATLAKINYFREMAGVPAGITFDPLLSAKCQDSALIMSSNNALSHTPPSNWLNWTPEGYDAANNGNIGVGSTGAEAISGYMADPGGNNQTVGHRRWLLLPQADVMGNGDVPGALSQGINSSNTLWVVPQDIGTRPATRDDFVAWPPAGHVPSEVVWPRWSFSYPGANFTGASVSMQIEGEDIPLGIEHAGSGFGSPESTLVWVPQGMNPNTKETWPYPEADESVEVTISNVLIGGQSETFTYTVTIFDPRKPGPEEYLLEASAPEILIKTAPAWFTVNSRPWSEGAQGRAFSTVEYTQSIDAEEGGLNPFIAEVSSAYETVISGRSGNTTHVFRLTHPTYETSRQSLFLQDELLVTEESAAIQFSSNIAWSTDYQAALLEVSSGDSGYWEEIWSNHHNETSNSVFETVEVDLTPWLDQTLQFRFSYIYTGGPGDPYYPGTNINIGWTFDNIAITGVEKVVDRIENSTTYDPGNFQITIPDAGPYKIQARDKVFGNRFTAWGPATEVEATTMTSVNIPAGQWQDDPVLGWLYGIDSSWKWSPLKGHIYVDLFPWIYTGSGWISYLSGSVYNGLWLFHAEDGYSYTQYDLGGWYLKTPFLWENPASWNRFSL